MAKGLKSYRDWLGAKLVDPERAARYLNAAAEDSEAMFLKALRKVAASQTRSMAELAEACGVSRESLYRMLSETGNPTSENRRAILAALGLKAVVVPIHAGRGATLAASIKQPGAVEEHPIKVPATKFSGVNGISYETHLQSMYAGTAAISMNNNSQACSGTIGFLRPKPSSNSPIGNNCTVVSELATPHII